MRVRRSFALSIALATLLGVLIIDLPARGQTKELGCNEIKTVTLSVSKDDKKVRVEPSKVLVRLNGCILWTITSDDTVPVSFDAIDFFDTLAEAQAAGKTRKSDRAVGDRCKGFTKNCLVRIDSASWSEGCYCYTARVKHGKELKKGDPDVEVTCENPPCIGNPKHCPQ